VFAGGFDVDAAEAVLDLSAHPGQPRAVEAVEALRDRSLVAASVPSGSDRLRFSLYGSVREFAREQLFLLGGREGAVLRHAVHYVTRGARWADRYDTGGTVEATAWLTRETENLLAVHRRMLLLGREGASLALGAALALDPLLAAVGPGALRLGLFDAALSAAIREEVSTDLRLRGLEARSDANRLLGRGPEAVADAQAALTLATTTGARASVGRVLRELAVLALMQGKLGEGRGLLDRACAIDRETGERREEGRALGLLGSVAALEGRLEAAWSTLERATCGSKRPIPATWRSSRTTPASSPRRASTASAPSHCAGAPGTRGSRPRYSVSSRRSLTRATSRRKRAVTTRGPSRCTARSATAAPRARSSATTARSSRKTGTRRARERPTREP
jgi:hypothetical protein